MTVSHGYHVSDIPGKYIYIYIIILSWIRTLIFSSQVVVEMSSDNAVNVTQSPRLHVRNARWVEVPLGCWALTWNLIWSRASRKRFGFIESSEVCSSLLGRDGPDQARISRISDFLRGWTEAFRGIVKLSKLFRFESPDWPSYLLLDRCSGFRAELGERYSNGVMPNGM